MAPNKFENNIKKTLEERQILPSSQAWNQLSDSLNKQDKKSANKYIWFIGIAASIIGVLFFVNTFQPFQNIENITSPSIVNTTSEIENRTEENISVNNTVANKDEIESAIIEEENEDKIETKTTIMSNKNKIATSKNTSKPLEIFVDKSEKNEIAQNNSIVSNDLINSSKSTIPLSDVKNDIADASINSEVDALLKQAKSKVSTLATSKETGKSINANSLLEDVESDLEKSFRDKVFETLKTNFTIVKTAVADRNN